MSTKGLWEQYAARSRWQAGAVYRDLPELDRDRLTRRHIVFYGGVQGRGFRYRCKLHCDALKVTGWCKNRLDGTVEGEFQSDPARLGLLLSALNGLERVQITRTEMETIPVQPEETAFTVLRY